jgi:hypothetical protein
MQLREKNSPVGAKLLKVALWGVITKTLLKGVSQPKYSIA